jgi:integrase/recombinase XerD
MTRPIRVLVAGPLEPYARGFWAELAEKGYTPFSAADQVRLMAHLSRWVQKHRLPISELTSERIQQFLRARRRAGYTQWLSERGLTQLLGYLRRLQVVPEPCPPMACTALERLLECFTDYLRRERGLVPSTIHTQRHVAYRFLTACSQGEELELNRLTAADVTRFVLQESRGRSVGYSKMLVCGLRSLLRFLHMEGWTPTQLASAAPTVAGWRLTSLPRALEPEQVLRLLQSCDRRTALGRRDYAILLLLARLGLRAGEVAALQLDDLDWRHGEIVIRGKGRQEDRLPLPTDVGRALVAYLRRGRQRLACRRVFLRYRAPQGALAPTTVTSVVYQACTRAQVPRVGAHRLRHTAATRMLQCGASLPEIAQVLRHRSLLTTAIYAKVDRNSLRSLVRPWPGVSV